MNKTADWVTRQISFDNGNTFTPLDAILSSDLDRYWPSIVGAMDNAVLATKEVAWTHRMTKAMFLADYLGRASVDLVVNCRLASDSKAWTRSRALPPHRLALMLLRTIEHSTTVPDVSVIDAVHKTFGSRSLSRVVEILRQEADQKSVQDLAVYEIVMEMVYADQKHKQRYCKVATGKTAEEWQALLS